MSLPSRERGLKYATVGICLQCSLVAPLAGARIEIHHLKYSFREVIVAPLAGARIEILMQDPFNLQVKSLPSRERGLKSEFKCFFSGCNLVAPLAGARIEIALSVRLRLSQIVAPLAGARIEILMQDPFNLQVKSLPSRERGLKFTCSGSWASGMPSLPSRERGLKSKAADGGESVTCRSPRGSAD